MESKNFYISKTKQKREIKILEQQKFLEKKRLEEIEKRWEDAQVKAATIQSALDYAVDQFNKHKAELTPEIVEQTEDMIAQRQKEVKEFLMGEKDLYVKRTGLLK